MNCLAKAQWPMTEKHPKPLGSQTSTRQQPIRQSRSPAAGKRVMTIWLQTSIQTTSRQNSSPVRSRLRVRCDQIASQFVESTISRRSTLPHRRERRSCKRRAEPKKDHAFASLRIERCQNWQLVQPRLHFTKNRRPKGAAHLNSILVSQRVAISD